MATFEKERTDTVEHLEKMGYIKDPRIKSAMLKVKRELFVTKDYKLDAYVDIPLPIVGGATISAPHMYAITFEAVKLKRGKRFLKLEPAPGMVPP